MYEDSARILSMVLLVPSAAMAQLRSERAMHDKAWYEAHRAERRATIRMCENDASYSVLPDCINAEAADGVASLREQQGRRRQIGEKGAWVGYDPMMDPDWWRFSNILPAQLAVCQRNRPGDVMLRYCPAARAAAAER